MPNSHNLAGRSKSTDEDAAQAAGEAKANREGREQTVSERPS